MAPQQVRNCITRVHIMTNHIFLDYYKNKLKTTSSTLPFYSGCAAKHDFCSKIVCQNGGVCVNRWNTHTCNCPLGYGGKNCEHGKIILSFQLFSIFHSSLDLILLNGHRHASHLLPGFALGLHNKHTNVYTMTHT